MDSKLFELGKDLGFSGEDLLAFVERERKVARDDRHAAREDRQEEERLLEKKLELARLQNSTGVGSSNGDRRNSAPSPKLPPFTEGKDSMDAYLNRFERYAENQGWPQTSWAISLSALLRGKSLDVYSRLSADQAKDNATLKDALLKRFELTADDFRKKFRFSNPESGETPSQFVVRLSYYLDKWIELSDSQRTYNGIVQLLLMQQVLEKGGLALALFPKERKPKSADEMASLADTFVEAHGGHFGVPKKNPPQTT